MAYNIKKIISVGEFCYESHPCQHNCDVIYLDDSKETIRLSINTIKKLGGRDPHYESCLSQWCDPAFYKDIWWICKDCCSKCC